MKRLLALAFWILCLVICEAQTIENPVFERTDVPAFRVERIEKTPDTTFVYCSYLAEKGSWVCISSDTYIEDVNSGTKYKILRSEGIPFGPEKITFENKTSINVLLCFPHIISNRINFIENESVRAFNIYGINLNESYSYSNYYTEYDVEKYRKLAIDKKEQKDLQSVIFYTLKQLEATQYVYGEKSLYSALAMYNLNYYYCIKEEYDKSIEWGKKTIDLLCVVPQDSITLDVLARAYGNVSTAYYRINQREVSLDYMEKSLTVRRLIERMSTINYEDYLQKLANNYYYEGNYPKALLYGREVANIFEMRFNENSYVYGNVYINALNNLCEFYQRMNKHQEALECGEKALRFIKEGYCTQEWLRYNVYNNLAGALLSLGQIDDGIMYLEMVISSGGNEDQIRSARTQLADVYFAYKRDTIRAEKEYLSILNDYGDYSHPLEMLWDFNRKKDRSKANDYLKRAIESQRKISGDNSIGYVNRLLWFVSYNCLNTLNKMEGVDSLLYYMEKSSAIIKRHINNSIYNMSKSEREDYWQRYENFFTWIIPTTSGIIRTNESNMLAYDASLFYKGMLLSSESIFRDIIKSSNDSILERQFVEYVQDLTQLEKLYSIKTDAMYIDSLKNKIKNEEFILSQKVTRFNKYNKGTNYSWREIKDNLGDNDVAIEIISYNSLDDKDKIYNAYVIDAKSIAPTFVFLFNESELKKCVRKNSMDYDGISSLIWGNEQLRNIIKDKKNIYFSPSGMLNTLGIEYLPIADNQHIYDKYNLYRLSSTRELCQKNKFECDNVCLYGGLDYNHKGIINRNYSTKSYRVSRSVVDSLKQRGGFEYLLGSEDEIMLLKEMMEANNKRCVVYTDKEGTEESFKSLSGKAFGVIHLSTHGMYVSNESDSIKQNNNFRFISDETSDLDYEDQMLTRSFLAMSGSNMLIQRDSISDDKDDGILTALEISHLDFSNLELVVLSACQTALGDIDNEGVYGLQRGFKKAGANTILMSLDKVDDEATKILMVEFYNNLMDGNSKYQSLKKAQQHLRKVDNGKYDKPEYWASFIMLDGLN